MGITHTATTTRTALTTGHIRTMVPTIGPTIGTAGIATIATTDIITTIGGN
jgi:hypothetical protein